MKALTYGMGALIAVALQTVTAASIKLGWTANTEPDIAGYRIYYGPPNSRLQVYDAGAATSATIPGLTAGVTYRFHATAYNVAGLESAPTAEIVYAVPASGGTDPGAGLPNNFVLRIIGVARLNGVSFVTFTAVSGLTFELQANDAFPTGPWQVIAAGPAQGNSMIHIDDTAAASPHRIYRVVKSAPR
jgi:hypothetical protein